MMSSLVVTVILVLVSFLFFYEPLLLGKVFYQKDILPFFYPMVHLNKEAIQTGYIPLWNPYVLSGIPHLATLEPAVFHPLSLLLYLFPFPYAYTLLMIVTYFLASVFMYLFAKNWGLSLEASLCSAIIFAYSGFTLSSISYPNVLFPLSWVPLIFLLLERSLTRKGILYPLGAGAVLSFQLFGGDFVPTMLTSLMIIGYTCFYLRGRSKEIILKLIILFAYALIFSMVQFLPTLELAQYALRGQGTDYAYLTRFSLHPLRILEFFIPNLLGTLSPTEYFWGKSFFPEGMVLFPSVYLGALTLPFMLFGIFSRKDKTILFLISSFIFSLILALGKYTPLYHFLYAKIPLFQMIPNPDKYTFWSIFVGATLTGLGVDQILKRYQTRKNLIKTRVGIFTLLLLLTLDLYRINTRAISLADEALYLDKPDVVTYLEREKPDNPEDLNKLYRIYRPSPLVDIFGIASYRGVFDQRDTLESNIGMLYRLSDAEGFVPAELAYYDTILKALEFVPVSKQLKLLAILNVRYLLTFKPLEDEKLEIAFISKEPLFWIYRLKDFAPRAGWVTPIAYSERKVEVLNHFIEERFDPRYHAILAPSSEFKGRDLESKALNQSIGFGTERTSAQENIHILAYGLTRVTLQTQYPSEGLLLLRDTYYPGWKAFVDDVETKILQANFIQRAIYVPKGEHLLQFRYEPFSYKLGLFLTLSAILVLLTQISVKLVNLRNHCIRMMTNRRTQDIKEFKAPSINEMGK